MSASSTEQPVRYIVAYSQITNGDLHLRSFGSTATTIDLAEAEAIVRWRKAFPNTSAVPLAIATDIKQFTMTRDALSAYYEELRVKAQALITQPEDPDATATFPQEASVPLHELLDKIYKILCAHEGDADDKNV